MRILYIFLDLYLHVHTEEGRFGSSPNNKVLDFTPQELCCGLCQFWGQDLLLHRSFKGSHFESNFQFQTSVLTAMALCNHFHWQNNSIFIRKHIDVTKKIIIHTTIQHTWNRERTNQKRSNGKGLISDSSSSLKPR